MAWETRLGDARGRRVVFLSHCLLNENTRYLGGAARPGCVREIVDACAEAGLGMVQLPCPEEQAWGGVHKRRLLRLYGSARWLPRPLRRAALPVLLAYTRWVYKRLARDAVRQIADYRRTGHEVVALVGVDGSPSCGVRRSLDIRVALERLAEADRESLTTDRVNAILRATSVPGEGMFTEQVRRRLRARRIGVRFVAHDLQRELDGEPSSAATALRDITGRR
ncbi:2-thiouracil desulfurase family protein [Actinomycetospora chibensis]|nr:2-thiouracil desulfurase family protein [Actinomycetospora chibensis]